MTLVFIFWGSYPGLADALACAKARAGCPVWVISNGPAPAGVSHMPIASFTDAALMRKALETSVGKWASFSLARWFVLRDLALSQHPDIFPIFCADWDVLLLRNLAEAYKPFEAFDYTVSRLPEGMESAAYGINRIEPLQAFCEMIQKLNEHKACPGNDMAAWSLNRVTHGWNVGNLYEIHKDSVFDHSMACGGERFVMDGEALKVVYEGGQMFFVKHDGGLVLANSAHCWSSWKSRTGEIQ